MKAVRNYGASAPMVLQRGGPLDVTLLNCTACSSGRMAARGDTAFIQQPPEPGRPEQHRAGHQNSPPKQKKPISTLCPDIAICAFCIKSATWKIRALVSISLPHAPCTNVISPSVLLSSEARILILSPTLVPGCELLAAALPAMQGHRVCHIPVVGLWVFWGGFLSNFMAYAP